MGQVTLYLDSQTEERMKAAAKAAGTSQSQWVATLIRERTSLEWPPSIVRLAGAWADDFPSLEEIRRGAPDAPPREPL
ncbi:MAG TPA: CopG family transcriptional regulator [Thermoanaerobaculia bacterium]|nr:CopG family transcriptional regulator [Thermoanaerobaculia bacterium]